MEQDALWSLFTPYRRRLYPGDLLEYALLLNDHYRGREAYFIFIEEASSVDPGEGIDAPNGAYLEPADLDATGRLHRFRASGVSARRFIRSLRLFSEELTAVSTDKQRARRRDELLRFFEEVPVLRFDIYVVAEDKEARAIALTMVPTSWTFVVLRRDRPEGIARQVLHSVDEAGPDEVHEGAWLHRVGPVSPPLELRLRDIFSLNHVRDAGLGLGGEEPPPPSDPHGDGGIRAMLDLARGQKWRPGGETVA